MKSLTRLFFVFVVLMFFSVDAWADKPKILQLKDLKPGTEAIGFSVFKGIEPEPFKVVLGNTIDNLGSSLISARISGGSMETPLEEIGAVAGMSGSPIFIGCTNLVDCVLNGSLVGALSYGPGNFIKGGPNVLLTPAEYMLGARAGGYAAAAQFINRMPDKINVSGVEFTNLMLFPKMDNLAGRGGTLGKCSGSDESTLKPGSMVSVFLANGAIPIAGSGTVTWRDYDNIYIFGHPFFGTGIVNYPFVHVAVADTIQTPIGAYKIPGCYLDTEGAMLVDGAYEMSGEIGETSPSIPLRVELRLNQGGAVLNEEIVPSPMARMLVNKLPGVWAEKVIGDLSFLSITYQVRVSIQDEPEIFLKNIIPVGVEKDLKNPPIPFEELFNKIDSVFVNLERNRRDYKIDGIKVRVDFVKNLKIWTKKTAFLSQNKAAPGETVYANVVLEEASSGATRQVSIPVKVPEDFMERIARGDSPNITLLIQGGNKFTDKKSPAERTSVEDFIKQLNQSMNYKTDVLYVQQIMPKPKVEQEADETSAKASVKPPWRWADAGEGDLRQYPSKNKNDVTLTLSPVLDDFIDLDIVLNLTVQSQDVTAPEKKEAKHRKWFFLFLF